jgi:hypothetical protein
MWLIILEALLALAILVLIVWWTMFAGRPEAKSGPAQSRPAKPELAKPQLEKPELEKRERIDPNQDAR